MDSVKPPQVQVTAMFTASQVEARTGVPAGTLRQWERRYGFPSPARSASGYRLYSPHDLAQIQTMQAHLRAGVPACRAAQLALEGVAPLPDVSEPAAGVSPAASWARALADALVASDQSAAEALLAEAHAQLPVEQVLTQVIAPALHDLGERWERGEITIAHEHQGTAFLRGRVSALMELSGSAEGLGPLVVAAGAPGEHHEIGLMMVSLTLRRRGVRVAYLGPNVPLGDLAVYVRQVGARALLLAVNGEWSLETLRAQRRDLEGLDVPVYYGGSLLNARPELAAELGGRYAGPDAPGAAHDIVEGLAALERGDAGGPA